VIELKRVDGLTIWVEPFFIVAVEGPGEETVGIGGYVTLVGGNILHLETKAEEVVRLIARDKMGKRSTP
jgi:uncharacterized protein YlzI (FlbEa/FlbD family)